MHRIPIILDTDANNELDDQHAIAYLLFNGKVFDPRGITINRTRLGGDIDAHAAEAERVVALCGMSGRITIRKGASASFEEILPHLNDASYDGQEAVQFIVEAARDHSSENRLVLAAIGKLTNVALALAKDPSIASSVRVLWLGSNYPDPGEYNMDNDVAAVNYVLDAAVPFEIVLVRYGSPTGTAAVAATLEEINARMPGKGLRVASPVPGRNGGAFTTFGDYSVSLFEHIELEGDPPSRPLYDMAALAILKNPRWARSRMIAAPRIRGVEWEDRPSNRRTIRIWEHFDRNAIMADFFRVMEHYELP